MRAIICGLALLFGGAAIAAESDVPPSAYFAIDGLDSNVSNLQRVIDRGCNAPEVNSLDRSTQAYLHRAVYVSSRQLVHSDAAAGERLFANAEQHIKNAQQIAERALNAAFRFADISFQHGCLSLADKYYRRIVETFIGNRYTAARERAQTAIDQIRARSR